jgi:hypothetical protein
MTRRPERILLVATPALALAAVGLGLRVGAGSAVRAAVVVGAPVSGAGTGPAWQVVVFDEDRGIREPVPHLELEVLAQSAGQNVRWRGATSDDGAAEVLLPLIGSSDVRRPDRREGADANTDVRRPDRREGADANTDVHLEVRAGSSLLASGDVRRPDRREGADANTDVRRPDRREGADANTDVRRPDRREGADANTDVRRPDRREGDTSRERMGPSWSPFARREGAVALEVAVLGQRVATGFPADLWVRASDATSGTALAGVDIEPEPDSSFVPATPHAATDAHGWAHVVATPVGHAVTVLLRARAPDGRTGEWAGALYVSPGAAQLAMDDRVSPHEQPIIDVVVPTLRTTAYVEIDDASGRAWAAAAPVAAPGSPSDPASPLPHVTVRAPRLTPGLYWAVEAGDPSGASKLGAGTIARPFFVAESDGTALAIGTAVLGCAPVHDPRDARRAVSACLALAAPIAVPRWTALDGFAAKRAQDAERRTRGLALALGAILVAVALEVVLLLRAAATSRARLQSALEGEQARGRLVGRAWSVGIALLVAVMGLVLLAAFLVRLS